jgi:uncharacterized protein YndB with AHSA1/START domain
MTEQTMNDLTLTVERTINATPEAVFAAWLDPEMLRRFMMPGPNMTVPVAKTEAVEGGRFEILMKTPENEIPHAGTYKKISPHDQIIFTWESPYSVEDSTVTLDFAQVDAGTHVRLHHVRFMDAQTRDNHVGGWTGILAMLDSVFSA